MDSYYPVLAQADSTLALLVVQWSLDSEDLAGTETDSDPAVVEQGQEQVADN